MKRLSTRLFSLALALIFALGAVPFAAFADDIVDSGECGEYLTWTLDSDGLLTIGGPGRMYSWSNASTSYTRAPWGGDSAENAQRIRAVVIEDGVTNIGAAAFYGCSNLTSVSLPASVTEIGMYAFSKCTGLTSVTIPDGVTQIDRYAFNGCTALASVTIPAAVTDIGAAAFYGCTALTSITIPNGVTSIGDSAFLGCTGLTSVELPDSVVSVGISAFRDCTQLSSVSIGRGLTRISNQMFYRCGLGSVTIPNNVTEIGDSAFYGCSALTSVTIPNNVTEIGESAFYGCSALTSVTIPDSVTNIGVRAFASSGLTRVTIGSGVTEIGDSAFRNCTALTSVTIPGNVKSIDNNAFYSCSGLTSVTIRSGVKSIGDYAFYSSGLTSLTIPGSVASVGREAFRGCTGLGSVAIQSGVTSIGNSAFYDCTALSSITVPDSVTDIGGAAFYNTAWYNGKSDGLVYAGKVAYKYKGTMSANTSITFDTGTKGIAAEAFYGCGGLIGVTIPASVKTIGGNAFYSCNNLVSIEIPSGVEKIGDYAFERCNALRSVSVPGSVTELGTYIFCYCTALESITLGTGITYIPLGFLYGNKPLQSVTIPYGVTEIGASAFAASSKLASVSIPATVKSIGNNAFAQCVLLNPVTIPNSVESIGQTAFSECKGFTNLTIGTGVKSIGEKAFYKCTGLQNVTIPANVTEIGNSAFSECSALTGVTVKNGVESIGQSAFSDCTSLSSVSLPASITKVGKDAFKNTAWLNAKPDGAVVYANKVAYQYKGTMPADSAIALNAGTTCVADYAFYQCGELASITFPDGLKTIGNSAFGKCEKLAAVSLPGSLTAIGNSAFRNCTALTSVTIPADIASIGGYAFQTCTALQSAEIASGVETVGNYMFADCTSLSSVSLPATVTNIKESAFRNCAVLTDLFILNPDCELGASVSGNTTVLHGYAGSAALIYANRNGRPFKEIVVHEHYGMLQGCVAATCTEDGYTGDYVCIGCAETLETGTVIPAIHHNWDYANAVFNWVGCACPNATVTCLNDPSHTTDVDVTVNSVKTDPTCEGEGRIVYTAFFEADGVTYNYPEAKTEVLGAAGHDWDYAHAVFNWDGYTCPNATVTCLTDATHTVNIEEITVTSVTAAPNCGQDGKTVYTAAFTVGETTYTDIKEETLNATPHDWNYAGAVFNWNGYDCATATVKCNNDPNHTKDVDVNVTSETTDPKCEEAGSTVYTASFTVNGETYEGTKTETLQATGHRNTTTVDATDSTCITPGYTAGVYCNDCKKWISGHNEKDLASHTWNEGETLLAPNCTEKGLARYTCTVEGCGKTEEREIPTVPDAHVYKDTVKAPTCTEEGYTLFTCTKCGNAYTDDRKPALGHQWNAPVWNWSGTSATATFVCRNGNHPQTVTAAVTSQTVQEPTDTEQGRAVYTATVTFEGVTYTDTAEKTLPSLNEGRCKWCGERHEGVWGNIVGFFHNILYFFAHLFGKR